MPEHGLLRVIYRWRVRVTLLFVILAIVVAEPKIWSILAGIGFTLIGLLLRTWACGPLEKAKKAYDFWPLSVHTKSPVLRKSFDRSRCGNRSPILVGFGRRHRAVRDFLLRDYPIGTAKNGKALSGGVRRIQEEGSPFFSFVFLHIAASEGAIRLAAVQ